MIPKASVRSRKLNYSDYTLRHICYLYRHFRCLCVFILPFPKLLFCNWLMVFAHVSTTCLLWSHIRQGPGIDLPIFAFLSLSFSRILSLCSAHRLLAWPRCTWVRGLAIKAKTGREQLCWPWASLKSRQSFGAYLARVLPTLSALCILSVPLPGTSLRTMASLRTLWENRNFWMNLQRAWILNHLLTLTLFLWCFYSFTSTLLAQPSSGENGGMVTHICHLKSEEAETGGLLEWGQPGDYYGKTLLLNQQ